MGSFSSGDANSLEQLTGMCNIYSICYNYDVQYKGSRVVDCGQCPSAQVPGMLFTDMGLLDFNYIFSCQIHEDQVKSY